jgi:hypothetical protein
MGRLGSTGDAKSGIQHNHERSRRRDGQRAMKMVVRVQLAHAVPSFLTLDMACTPCPARTSHAAWVIDTYATSGGGIYTVKALRSIRALRVPVEEAGHRAFLKDLPDGARDQGSDRQHSE